MALYIKDNKIYNSFDGIPHDGYITNNATEEEILSWGYEPYVPTTTAQDEASEREAMILDMIYGDDGLIDRLSKTDYIALKSIEGYECDELYPGWKEARKALRDRIDQLEQELEELKQENVK